MKKNFFKKLSFVLALAMIVSVLAPAAGAFAAKAPKLNASTKYLYLGVDGKDEFDFNISNKASGWKYLWSSANKNVATVNKKNGVTTATGAGTTKISVVISDKKGEEVDELTATVTVRDNIKELTITNLPKDGQVAVGVAHDFNRSYVTVANKTKGSKAITRWSVSPSEDATITDSGVFTATKAGEYTITARAFQSKAKYTSWLADATKYASYVTAEATYKVKVAASMVKAEQVDLDTFKLSFDSEVTDTTKIAIVRLVGTTEVVEVAKKVTLSDDKKVATVDMHNDFAAGSTYVVRYTDMKDVQFIAATTKAEDVKEIKILTNQVQVFETTEIKIALLNADGVNIATSDLLTRVTLETADTNIYLQNKDVTMYTIGNTANVTAKFHTWKYDGGTEVGALEVKGVLTCVEKVLDKATSIVASDVATSYDNFKKVNHTIAVDDTNFRLYVKALIDVANGDDYYEINSQSPATSVPVGVDAWQMSSSNTSVLLVDDYGRLTPVGVGTASVIVKWDEVVVGSIAITVGARREVSVVSLNTNQFTLSNDNDVNDNKVIEVTVKDQYGDKMDGGKYNLALDRTNQPATGTYVNTVVDTAKAAGSDGSQKYKFETPMGTTTATGTYVYKITATDTSSWKAIPTYVTVNVAAPSSTTVSTSYRLEANNTTYDMNLNEWSGDNATDVTLSLFGYASNGIRNQRVSLNTVTVDILGAGTGYDDILSRTTVTRGADYVIHLTPASGTQIVKADKGSWTVTAVSGTAISTSVTFGVQDTQAAPTYTFDSPFVTLDNESDPLSHADVVAALDKAITFNLKGDEIAVANLINLDYSVVGKTVYVRSVQYQELLSNSNYILHTINLGKTITVK